MADYRRWALEVLGLAGPLLQEQLVALSKEKDPVSKLKAAARKKGAEAPAVSPRPIPWGSEEALQRFRAINEALQVLDDLVLAPVKPPEVEKPRTTVSISFYPESHPSGPVIETRTLRRSYFDFMTEETHSSGIQYDATRVVPMRPRKKF